ncbi:MAG: SUMF1/EgtB/PvdO family nonheme iron enzyme [Candidatus Hydrogenedentes bacterium]|nr:SUMF1/EgtB/PvdO family nonheme iron enzyme [Candidatus Hydrogenedentota bacterium]
MILDTDRRGSNRVNRGGSWNNNFNNCRSAQRNNNTPTNTNNNIGFRLSSSSRRQIAGVYECPRRVPVMTRPVSCSGLLSGQIA